MTAQVHSGSAANRITLERARDALATRVSSMTQQRAALLTETTASAIGWMPVNYGGEQAGREATIEQAAVRLAEIDRDLAAAQSAVDAADELLSAFDNIVNPE